MPSGRILIVDDDALLRESMVEFLELKGFAVAAGATAKQAVEHFHLCRPDVMIVDHRLPDGDALSVLACIRKVDAIIPIIILTGYATIDLAVRAIKEGADQFLTKPVEMQALLAVIEKQVQNQRTHRRQVAGANRRARYDRDPFVGTSDNIRRLQESVLSILGTDRPILITGETGSGKGVLASWMHTRGPRCDEPILDLNCAGLTRDLLESELFGHERGSFTGAVAPKPGLLEVADKGTVFLDEIGDMDPTIQPKLLKVLEEKKFRRIGELKDRTVDVQLISATHQNLQSQVAEGKFRSDLYFRVSTIPLRIPPLRERKEDIPPIAETLMRQLAADLGKTSLYLRDDAIRAMQQYSWPGNIRELRNVLERAALLCRNGEIGAQDLLFESLVFHAPESAQAQIPFSGTLADVERQYISQVLEEECGKVERAALRLGVPRSTLYAKIKQYSLSAEKRGLSART